MVAGQGTASLELIEEVERQGASLDALVVPVGGGGGLAGACLAARGRPITVYGVEPVEPATLAWAVLPLLVFAAVAGLIPARRASRLDPMTALRSE